MPLARYNTSTAANRASRVSLGTITTRCPACLQLHATAGITPTPPVLWQLNILGGVVPARLHPLLPAMRLCVTVTEYASNPGQSLDDARGIVLDSQPDQHPNQPSAWFTVYKGSIQHMMLHKQSALVTSGTAKMALANCRVHAAVAGVLAPAWQATTWYVRSHHVVPPRPVSAV